jgi:hypothetical protein
MGRAKASAPLLTGELEEFLGLLEDADSLELKLTVPDEDRQSAVAALGIDPLDARLRQVPMPRRASSSTTSLSWDRSTASS